MDNDSDNNESTGLRMSLRERPRKLHALRERDELKYLDDYEPERSSREKRKLKKKPSGSVRNVYDDIGCIRHNGLDLCDCMNDDCPGCWYECENCGSTKCGVQCRVNRKFYYEQITFDGKDTVIKNKFFHGK